MSHCNYFLLHKYEHHSAIVVGVLGDVVVHAPIFVVHIEEYRFRNYPVFPPDHDQLLRINIKSCVGELA